MAFPSTLASHWVHISTVKCSGSELETAKGLDTFGAEDEDDNDDNDDEEEEEEAGEKDGLIVELDRGGPSVTIVQ